MIRNPEKKLLPIEQTFTCYDRCPREEQFIRNARDEISMEDVDKLYRFLQGEVPPELTLDHPPKLTQEEAFSVIYYLQEIMGLLPCKYERCCKCGDLYDSREEGTTIDKYSMHTVDENDGGPEVEKPWDESMYGNYCDGCRPD